MIFVYVEGRCPPAMIVPKPGTSSAMSKFSGKGQDVIFFRRDLDLMNLKVNLINKYRDQQTR